MMLSMQCVTTIACSTALTQRICIRYEAISKGCLRLSRCVKVPCAFWHRIGMGAQNLASHARSRRLTVYGTCGVMD